MKEFSSKVGSTLWAIALCLFLVVSVAWLPQMIATFIHEVQNNITEIQK